MDVAVDNRHALHPAVALEDPDGDGDIVQNAVPLTAIRKRVVRPACQIDAHGFANGNPGGRECALDGCPRSPHQRLRTTETPGGEWLQQGASLR